MRRPKWLLIVVLAAAAFGGGLAPSAAEGDVVSDGVRLAAWPVGATTAVVYDDRTQRRRRVSVPDCPLTAVGGGRLLLSCPGEPTPVPVVVDVRTGRQTELAQLETQPPFVWSTTTWIGVGLRGVLANLSGARSSVETGYEVAPEKVRPLDDRRTAIDLDVTGLARPLCGPLRRTRTPDDPLGVRSSDPYVPMAFQRPWAVETVPVYRREDGTLYDDGMVRAWRCGKRRPLVLARRCGCKASFGAGLVAWRQRDPRGADPRLLRAVDLATGRRRAWRVAGSTEVAQAGRTLLVFRPQGARHGPSRLIRWPRPRRR